MSRLRYKATFFILSALGLLALVTWADSPKTTLPSPPQSGRFTLVIKSGAFDRVAHVHIPKGFKADSKPPLVLVLHGAGGSGPYVLNKDGWAAKADQEGFVAVAPDGLPAFPRLPPASGTNPAIWNSGQLKPNSPRAAVDDVSYLKQLLDQLNSNPREEALLLCTSAPKASLWFSAVLHRSPAWMMIH